MFTAVLINIMWSELLWSLISYQKTKDSYAVHLFNAITKSLPILPTSGFMAIAADNCPVVSDYFKQDLAW